MPRFTDQYGALYDRLYSRWAVVIKTDSGYSPASHARYADRAVSAGELPVITPRNRKGLGDFRTNAFEPDLDDLTISYITVNIRINDFLCSKPERQEGVIPFVYNGKEYYADRTKISEYDAIMRSAHQRNIIVSAIILVYPEHSSKDRATGRILEHPEYETSGAYSMPNMTTPESLNLYAAGIDFLALRYSRSDALSGHIHRWIVHNEIDAGAVWTSAGRKDIYSYMDIYMKSLRLVYLTALKYNKNAEVFVPFTHFWKDRFNDECYAPSDMLEILLLYSRKEGDFRWGIAYHAYPADLIEPKSWLDNNVTSDFQTPLITFKNLEVLNEWAKQPDTFYQNREPRKVMLSEQNPNSRDYSERELNEQTACLAYAWKKMQACSQIEAYIAHSWIDAHFEGGLKTGLRKYPDDPSGRKPAWYVFSSLGTDREDGACEFAKKIIGINEWKEIYNR
ncbi:MAG: DUF5722 domain-containing protein [Prevotellaceae bacterium]|jgi:hypothetical protein|nr:DUF5722 domain-containing protein [Prevotellaceae bacterium]